MKYEKGILLGKLLVIGFKQDTVKGISLWVRHCDCGGEKTIAKTGDLTSEYKFLWLHKISKFNWIKVRAFNCS